MNINQPRHLGVLVQDMDNYSNERHAVNCMCGWESDDWRAAEDEAREDYEAHMVAVRASRPAARKGDTVKVPEFDVPGVVGYTTSLSVHGRTAYVEFPNGKFTFCLVASLEVISRPGRPRKETDNVGFASTK